MTEGQKDGEKDSGIESRSRSRHALARALSLSLSLSGARFDSARFLSPAPRGDDRSRPFLHPKVPG